MSIDEEQTGLPDGSLAGMSMTDAPISVIIQALTTSARSYSSAEARQAEDDATDFEWDVMLG
ncbi:hypothetical protein [Lacisediminihabitans changchengi]|uniref:Uncharacterized protein n=1 Tax=Lacisediminihabitans changchengi TaxID=2787634 RepID=A0A934W4V0_9MICO|nr:hypothetical protein [Lacisediminihabitans changchengi]MBK4347027.1 hypothetical protein [Lacisediminihabitans changchengi]MBK4347850.1 hypothetical protein [Lacisediminihabitans changchengi]